MPGYDRLMRKLADDDASRLAFLAACLTKLGLEVSRDAAPVPPLSDIHLSAIDGTKVSELLCAWEDVVRKDGGHEYIDGGADTFVIQSDDGSLPPGEPLHQSLPVDAGGGDTVDYAAVTKRVVAHENAWPSRDATPRFDHALYYSSLGRFRAVDDAEDWGGMLMYGDVVTSTNSLLER